MKKLVWNLSKPTQYYKGIRIMADTNLHEQIADVVQSVVPKGASILDYGAGEGALSQRLQDMGYMVCSIDVDQQNFKAQTVFERVDLNNPSETEKFLAAHAEEFDLVLGIEVIEHIENPWQYLRDVKRLVKHRGSIVISTPNITSWYSRANFFFKGRFHQFEDTDRNYGHINPIAIDELQYICEQTGLHVEKVVSGGWLPRLWLSKSPKQLMMNVFGFLGSFVMGGTWDGWCIIAVARKL